MWHRHSCLCIFANHNIVRVKNELSRCANLAAMNLPGLFDACDQFVEELLLHLNAEDTSTALIFASRARTPETIDSPAARRTPAVGEAGVRTVAHAFKATALT